MNRIEIHTSQGLSTIYVGEGMKRLSEFLPPQKRVVVITDRNLMAHYGTLLSAWPTIVTEPGEAHKTLATLQMIYGKLAELNADRNTFLLGVGGGIVTDITGMVAATWMRGVEFGFVSTTLLSQVDASVGGKNGVNFEGYKNMIGTFLQPRWVLCDIGSLSTLGDTEFRQGFAEIIKAAAILDPALFSYLEAHASEALNRNPEVLRHIIGTAISLKAGVVMRDEKESGERRILNFGHTFGHAIEKLTHIAHGDAVSVGMVMAANLSVQLSLLRPQAAERLIRLLALYRLPVTLPLTMTDLTEIMLKDKKKENDSLNLVLLQQIGATVIHKVPVQELPSLFQNVVQSTL